MVVTMLLASLIMLVAVFIYGSSLLSGFQEVSKVFKDDARPLLGWLQWLLCWLLG